MFGPVCHFHGRRIMGGNWRGNVLRLESSRNRVVFVKQTISKQQAFRHTLQGNPYDILLLHKQMNSFSPHKASCCFCRRSQAGAFAGAFHLQFSLGGLAKPAGTYHSGALGLEFLLLEPSVVLGIQPPSEKVFRPPKQPRLPFQQVVGRNRLYTYCSFHIVRLKPLSANGLDNQLIFVAPGRVKEKSRIFQIHPGREYRHTVPNIKTMD